MKIIGAFTAWEFSKIIQKLTQFLVNCSFFSFDTQWKNSVISINSSWVACLQKSLTELWMRNFAEHFQQSSNFELDVEI